MSKRLFVLLSVFIAASMLFSACASKSASPMPTPAENIVNGVSFDCAGITWYSDGSCANDVAGLVGKKYAVINATLSITPHEKYADVTLNIDAEEVNGNGAYLDDISCVKPDGETITAQGQVTMPRVTSKDVTYIMCTFADDTVVYGSYKIEVSSQLFQKFMGTQTTQPTAQIVPNLPSITPSATTEVTPVPSTPDADLFKSLGISNPSTFWKLDSSAQKVHGAYTFTTGGLNMLLVMKKDNETALWIGSSHLKVTLKDGITFATYNFSNGPDLVALKGQLYSLTNNTVDVFMTTPEQSDTGTNHWMSVAFDYKNGIGAPANTHFSHNYTLLKKGEKEEFVGVRLETFQCTDSIYTTQIVAVTEFVPPCDMAKRDSFTINYTDGDLATNGTPTKIWTLVQYAMTNAPIYSNDRAFVERFWYGTTVYADWQPFAGFGTLHVVKPTPTASFTPTATNTPRPTLTPTVTSTPKN